MLDGIITRWNPAAERLYGYAREEILGESARRLNPADRADEFCDALVRIAEEDRWKLSRRSISVNTERRCRSP
jgi:PAS domain S-box-containing protein